MDNTAESKSNIPHAAPSSGTRIICELQVDGGPSADPIVEECEGLVCEVVGDCRGGTDVVDLDADETLAGTNEDEGPPELCSSVADGRQSVVSPGTTSYAIAESSNVSQQ